MVFYLLNAGTVEEEKGKSLVYLCMNMRMEGVGKVRASKAIVETWVVTADSLLDE